MVTKIKLIHQLKAAQGFSLIEVMIAIAIFAVFVVSFMTGQGFNLLDSTQMREDSKLEQLAQMKFNEIIVDPPPFRESLTSASKETKPFEEDPGFTWTTELTKFTIPDLMALTSSQDEDPDPIQARIFEQFKKNMEKMLWQMKLTVTNKETGQEYVVSGWLYNPKAKVQIQGL